ncbi:MAG TPA: hypothetical protein VNO50_22740 [Pyrinomonadaceae bacterium]|nr:hypothetical protein [Pyrinomonadaceae bacterium]
MMPVNRRFCRPALVLTVLFVVLIQPPASFACGPFTLGSVFTFKAHPEYPLEKFAEGEIGIVQPSYARSYLYVAYRYLGGGTFSPADQKALVDLWKDRLEYRSAPGDQDWIKEWQTARQKVLSGKSPEIDVYRNREKPNQFESFLNCQQDAFQTAAATLAERARKAGAESPELKQWAEAQDLVFANCSEGQHIPLPLSADANELLRADRAYQIAAANFYAGNFDLAKTQFAAIALDAKSPWRVLGPYMVARTLIRKASLGPEETRKVALVEAEDNLSKILKKPELESNHAAARRLMNIVSLRLHPEERLHELGRLLAGNPGLANLKQDLWDYTVLLDQFVGDDEAHHQQEAARTINLQADDLTDWITTIQSEKPEALDHAVQRWQAMSSGPWLVAALAKVKSTHGEAARLQAAAAQLPPTSPAFATASFHLMRLNIEAGRFAEARTYLDGLFRKNEGRLNRSTLNLLHHQRLMVSDSLEDFLTHAQRIPAGFSWDDGNREIPVDDDEFGEGEKPPRDRKLFDSDAGSILNLRMPLALLSQIPNSTRLPENLRRDVTQAVWLRAILLDNPKTATSLTPTLKTLVPAMTPVLNEYLSARGPAAKKFAGVYAWLKYPGLEPFVDDGVGRGMSLGEQDSYRDNWWCGAAFLDRNSSAVETAGAKSDLDSHLPPFLTPAQLAVAQKEYAELAAMGASPNYLSRQVIEWATKNPTDPRVPEALHLAVKTSRYGCADKETGGWSKAAHDLLHRRYPNNEWTKKTPYWFKN